jgi:DNA-binding NtrC family response regulator
VTSSNFDHSSDDGLRSSGSVGFYRGAGSETQEAVGSSLVSGTASLTAFDPLKSYGETRSAFESDFEKRYVAWLLSRHHNNVSAAAREARMDRKHLHDLAKKHGLRAGSSRHDEG